MLANIVIQKETFRLPHWIQILANTVEKPTLFIRVYFSKNVGRSENAIFFFLVINRDVNHEPNSRLATFCERRGRKKKNWSQKYSIHAASNL